MKNAFKIIKNKKIFNCKVGDRFKNVEKILLKLRQLEFFNLLFKNSTNSKKADKIIQAKITKNQRKVL